MTEPGTREHLLEEIKLGIGAITTVFLIFYTLGRLKQTRLPIISKPLETETGFFITAFTLIGLTAISWITFQIKK